MQYNTQPDIGTTKHNTQPDTLSLNEVHARKHENHAQCTNSIIIDLPLNQLTKYWQEDLKLNTGRRRLRMHAGCGKAYALVAKTLK